MTFAAVSEQEPGTEGNAEVEILFFQIKGERLGVDASQVLRIDRPGLPTVQKSPLSSPRPRRALIFRAEKGEGALEVDMVHGVRSALVRELRRVPTAARVSDYALGFWLDGERPVLLIDLPRTLVPAQAPVASPPQKET